MRWFGGAEEGYLQTYFCSSRIQPKCTCSSSSSSRHLLSSLPKQPSASREQQLKKVKSASHLLNEAPALLKHFLKYVETIVKSERRLELLREGLRGHKR